MTIQVAAVQPRDAPHLNRVYALTGAGSGIGRATALILAAEGAILALSDLHFAALDTVKAEIEALGGRVAVTVVDVTKSEAVEAWIEETVKLFGKLDGAVNCAGVPPGIKREFTTIVDEEWDHVMNVNLTGVRNAMRAELKYLGTGSSIVNLASVAGVSALANFGAYCASKHAVVAITKVAAKEYGPKGVRVNALCPGPIITPLYQQGVDEGLYTADSVGQATALQRCGQPEEVGEFAAFLLGSRGSYATGCAFPIDGGFLG